MATRPVKSGIITLNEHMGYGGSSFDSRDLSSFFNYDKPHNFGMIEASIFTSSKRFTTKILTGLTYARGNYVESTNDIYRWKLKGDDERLFRVSEFVEVGNARPGYGGQEFTIVLDKPWMHEPDIISAENNRFAMEIVGYPQKRGEGRYAYRVRMQSGDPTKYLPTAEMQVGRTFRKETTSVATERNDLYGTGQWGSQIELQSQVGMYAEGFDVSDKVVRMELQARKKGNYASSGQARGAMSGYEASFTASKDGKEITQSMFISYMEADLAERINYGREWMCVFGETSERLDNSGRYIKRTGPGWRKLAEDGHVLYHNGSLTAANLEDYLIQIFLYRKNLGERTATLDVGTLANNFLSQLLSDEASAFLTVDSHFIRQAPGGESHQLEYGAEFISFTTRNGIKVRRVLNPFKDDRNVCRRMHPDNSIFTVDSGRMDIYDFASNTASVAPDQSNMTMIMQAGVDSYFWVSDLIDKDRGIVNDGSRVSSAEKGISCRREASGSLGIFDTARIGSLIYEPEVFG